MDIDTKDANYRYIGVSHSYTYPVPGGCVNLTWSNDLRTWHFSHAIECGDSSQASIRRLSDGSFLVAYEYNPQSLGASVKVRHYASLAALLSNTLAGETVAPRLSGVLNAGTPSFREIYYQGGGLNSMQFEIPYHHCQVSNCIDEQGFMTWN